MGNVLTVEALSKKFSPIVDRLYEKEENILIYYKNDLTYYGRDIKRLIKDKVFEILLEQNKAYYGGDFGYFGIADTTRKIVKYKNKILEILNA